MATLKDLENTPIYSITNGKFLGEIKDLYLDKEINKIVAIHTGKEGILSRKSLAISRSRITLLGQDAWFSSEEDVVDDEKNLPELKDAILAESLRGRGVETAGGTKIGEIGDIMLDTQGRVIGFTLGRVIVQGPLAERKSIARAAITHLGDKSGPMIADLSHAEGAEPV